MKKQFFRVKQLADQTFLRADKSEVFNHEELQIADHRVEYLRGALAAISKRIPSVSSVQNSEGNIEKRMKKYSEFQLGQVFHEQGHRTRESIEDDCQLLQYILRECGQVELDLAKEQAEHELKVEQLVSAPLQAIIDNDLPNIFKHKQNLKKYILDKDSASNRYHAASKNGPQREALKDDMEEADSKVEQHRDVLAAEMFNLLKKESELSQYILQLLKLQRAYHESALKNLEKVIPKLEQSIGDSPVKAVFGLNLEEHLRVTSRKIAYPLELCICALSEIGMLEEGLFRVVGGASRVKRLKLSIDSGCFSPPLLQEYQDVHVLASTLKLYLRELPEPLLTYTLYDEWMASMKYPEEQRIPVIQEILKKLPTANKNNLTYLVQFLAKLSKNQENKMSSSNLAIVMAPNLLWHKNKEMDIHMGNCATLNTIVELFINKGDVLFPDNVSQYLTLTRSDLFAEEPEFQRPVLNNVKLLNHENVAIEPSGNVPPPSQPHSHNTSISSSTGPHPLDSPRPQTRLRKNKLAPTPPSMPPVNRSDGESVTSHIPPSYPSGSTTLTRAHKVKAATSEAKPQADQKGTLPRRQSLVLDAESVQQNDAANLSSKATAPISVDDQQVKVKPTQLQQQQQIAAQALNVEKLTITSNSLYQKPLENNKVLGKPIAAPRTFINDESKTLSNSSRNQKGGSADNLMTKSLNSIDVEGDSVQVRKQVRDDGIERPNKPTVPMRPASLKAMPRSTFEGGGGSGNGQDPAVQRTQCSVYSVAHKQQPSYVNIQLQGRNSVVGEKHLPGHDTQIAEKERFLGHTPQPENGGSSDTLNRAGSMRARTSSLGNGNKPEVPPKTSLAKSNEKLNADVAERVNGVAVRTTGHARTQSDGNIVESGPHLSVLHTPPSPRSLNKPTEPPPPPPVMHRPKSDAPGGVAPHDSTDL